MLGPRFSRFKNVFEKKWEFIEQNDQMIKLLLTKMTNVLHYVSYVPTFGEYVCTQTFDRFGGYIRYILV